LEDNLLSINKNSTMQTKNLEKLLKNSKNLLNTKKQIILYGPPGT
jgi:DNA replication protein DnaC